MNKEDRFIVMKREGEKAQFLRHEGHAQYWTKDRTDAMEYTRPDVADALAKLHGGFVQAI